MIFAGSVAHPTMKNLQIWQKMKKSLVQLAFNPFFGWFGVPVLMPLILFTYLVVNEFPARDSQQHQDWTHKRFCIWTLIWRLVFTNAICMGFFLILNFFDPFAGSEHWRLPKSHESGWTSNPFNRFGVILSEKRSFSGNSQYRRNRLAGTRKERTWVWFQSMVILGV